VRIQCTRPAVHFYRKRSRPRKTPPPNVGFGVGPSPSAKHKLHIGSSLDAKMAAGEVHNGERGFHIHTSKDWVRT
jgi:hypothetical protein